MFNSELLKKKEYVGRKSKLSQKEIDKIIELTGEGYTQKSIAAAFGLTQATICRILKKHKAQ